MIYEYKCKDHGVYDVVKHHSESDKEERCPECKSKMKKLISRGARVSAFKEEFYHAFGKHISSKRQIKEELSRIKGETGKELVEVGDETGGYKRSRRRISEKEIKQAYRELKGALNG